MKSLLFVATLIGIIFFAGYSTAGRQTLSLSKKLNIALEEDLKRVTAPPVKTATKENFTDNKDAGLKSVIKTTENKIENWHRRVLYVEDMFHAYSSVHARLCFDDLYKHYKKILSYLNKDRPSDPTEMIYWDTARQYFPLREVLMYSGFSIGRYPVKKNNTSALNDFYKIWRERKFNIRIEITSVLETPNLATKYYSFSGQGNIYIRKKPIYKITKDDFKGIETITLLIKGWEEPISENNMSEEDGFGASTYLYNIFEYDSQEKFKNFEGYFQQNVCDSFIALQELKKAYYRILQKMYPDELKKTEITMVNKKVALYSNKSGIKHFNNKEYNLAVEKFSSAVFLWPDSPSFYYNLGSAYFKCKIIDEALKNWEKAITLKHPETEKIRKLIEKAKKIN